MKKRSWSIAFIILLIAISLSACSVHFEADGVHFNEQNQNKTNKIKEKSKESKIHKKSITSKQVKNRRHNNVWTKQKAKKLDDAFSKWASKRQQRYQKYNGKPLKTNAGTVYPNIFKTKKFLFNGKLIRIKWDPKLKNSKLYNVVAIYNDNFVDTKNHFTFLFCIHNTEAIILQEIGNNSNPIIVSKLKDIKLNHEFREIYK